MELAKNQKEALTEYLLGLGVNFDGEVDLMDRTIFNEEAIMHDITLKYVLKIFTEVMSLEEIMYDILNKYSVLIPVCVLEEFINK